MKGPGNMINSIDWQTIATAASTLLTAAIIFWLKLSKDEYKDLRNQVNDLKVSSIPRIEMHREIDTLRIEVMARHSENKAAWERIEGKIDKYEEGNARLRHDLSDQLHDVSLKVAVIATTLGIRASKEDQHQNTR